MGSQGIQQEVERLLELLRSDTADERLEAATELRALGLRARGEVRIRGAALHAASPRLRDVNLEPALRALADAQWEVRKEVALAVGEWADERAVEVLGHLARTNPEWRVRIAAVEALSNIGGPMVVKLLTGIAKSDPYQDVRARALEGLGDLALAAWPELSEKQGDRIRGTVRTRGAPRIRGSSHAKPVSPEAASIMELLDDARFNDQSTLVRDAADATLAQLDE